jgi:hypothetical protein
MPKSRQFLILGILFVMFGSLSFWLNYRNRDAFWAKINKFNKAEVSGTISKFQDGNRGTEVIINDEEYWFASYKSGYVRFTNYVEVGDFFYKKYDGDTIWVTKAKSNEKIYFTFVRWDK